MTKTQRIRILLVHTGADMYGASRSFLRLSSRLVQDGHEVLAVLPYEGPLLDALCAAGVKTLIDPGMTVFTRDRFRNAWRLFGLLATFPHSVYRFCSIIRKFRPEVVHTNTAVAISPPVAARCCGVPHLWHIREFFVDFPRLWPFYQWMMFTLSDRIACVSGAVAGQFDPRYQRKTLVLHNGFPREEFQPVPAERTALFRQKFGLDGHKTVGLVGRIKLGRKGQEVFVRAAAIIKAQFPGTRFLCIGSPFPGNEQHLERLEQLVDQLQLREQFVYTGDVADIKAAYSALDLSVLASAQPEPFGGVVIESMAMGVPVVGTAVGGTVEQIEDGVSGILVRPGDPESMASAIARLLSSPNLRKRFGAAARERFVRHFEFEPFYQKMLLLYQSLAGDKGAHA